MRHGAAPRPHAVVQRECCAICTAPARPRARGHGPGCRGSRGPVPWLVVVPGLLGVLATPTPELPGPTRAPPCCCAPPRSAAAPPRRACANAVVVVLLLRLGAEDLFDLLHEEGDWLRPSADPLLQAGPRPSLSCQDDEQQTSSGSARHAGSPPRTANQQVRLRACAAASGEQRCSSRATARACAQAACMEGACTSAARFSMKEQQQARLQPAMAHAAHAGKRAAALRAQVAPSTSASVGILAPPPPTQPRSGATSSAHHQRRVSSSAIPDFDTIRIQARGAQDVSTLDHRKAKRILANREVRGAWAARLHPPPPARC